MKPTNLFLKTEPLIVGKVQDACDLENRKLVTYWSKNDISWKKY